LNRDGLIGENNEGDISFCEDRIYCPLVSDCECGVKLTLTQCEVIMTEYYTSTLGMSQEDTDNIIAEKLVYTNGACN